MMGNCVWRKGKSKRVVCVIQDAFDSSRLSVKTAMTLGDKYEFQLDMDFQEVAWIL